MRSVVLSTEGPGWLAGEREYWFDTFAREGQLS